MWIEVQANTYSIYIGQHVLSQAALFAPVANKQVCIVSSPEVASHYLPLLTQTCLQAQALKVDSYLIPGQDHYKTLESAQLIWSTLISQHHYRDSIMISLGGGMIGDLAGFCAACFMRGIPIIQCPTTLLAQIDAAIGGKTGVNFAKNKNMIGLFYQPLLVISDLNTLHSLPQREFVAGFAELIKYAMILDAPFFNWLELNSQALLSKEKAALEYAIVRASQIKVSVVSQDEKEAHLRAILNFGHTIAHALESILEYQTLLHGEAVAIGMVVATQLSIQTHHLDKKVLDRLINLLEKVGLPIKIPSAIPIVEILAKIKHDKKHKDKKLQWVLLSAIGKAIFDNEVKTQQISEALEFCGAQVR